MTVLEVIQRSAEFLAKKGVDSPRLQVELLLSHVLRLPRMGLYLNFGRELTPKELDDVREMVRRRGLREPLQHITGSTSFCGLEMTVSNKVLVPRPETELLAELGWNFLSAEGGVWSAELGKEQVVAQSGVATHSLIRPSGTFSPNGSERGSQAGADGPIALDFGTGSGCLAITLAVKCPAARVVAVDISEDALAVARANAARHQMESRIEFVLGDGFGALPPSARFDLIVGNPPYIPSAEIATLDPEVRDHDPRLALDGGADGLDFYTRLAREAGARLKPGGRIMLEFGDGQEHAVQKHFELQKWIVAGVKADYSGRPRILIARQADSPGRP